MCRSCWKTLRFFSELEFVVVSTFIQNVSFRRAAGTFAKKIFLSTLSLWTLVASIICFASLVDVLKGFHSQLGVVYVFFLDVAGVCSFSLFVVTSSIHQLREQVLENAQRSTSCMDELRKQAQEKDERSSSCMDELCKQAQEHARRSTSGTKELRRQVQDLAKSVQHIRTLLTTVPRHTEVHTLLRDMLLEHRAHSDCQRREDAHTINTMRESLDTLLAQHNTMEHKSAQHADETDRELRALRCSHTALEEGVGGRFFQIATEIEVIKFVHAADDAETRSNQSQLEAALHALRCSHAALEEGIDGRCLQVAEGVVKKFGKEMHTWHMDDVVCREQLEGAIAELRHFEEQSELREEQHSEVRALSGSLQKAVRDLQEEVRRIDGKSEELTQLQQQSRMRTEGAADGLTEVRRALKDQEKLVQRMLTSREMRAEVMPHQRELDEIRRGVEEQEKLMLRHLASEASSEHRASSGPICAGVTDNVRTYLHLS